GIDCERALRVLEEHAPELRSWLAREGAEEGVHTVTLELELLDAGEEGFFANEGQDGGAGNPAHGRQLRGSVSRRERATNGPSAQQAAVPAQLLATSISESGVDLVA
ncbi:MAG: hypothetical protein AAGG01_09765, partial [Planctomycetota bacterium]